MRCFHPLIHHRSGFSLLELLVAIALIFTLAALGFRQAGAMRERAREVTCLGKMRRFGPAISAYVAEHNGALPTGIKNRVPGMNSRIGYSISWGIAILPYMVGGSLKFSDQELEQRAEYFRCPSDEGFVAAGDGAWSYGWNQPCGNGMDPTEPPYPAPVTRANQYPEPSKVPVVAEAHHAPGSSNRNFSFFYSDTHSLTNPTGRPELSAMRHPALPRAISPADGGKGPPRRYALFLDGHVAKSALPTELTDRSKLLQSGLLVAP